MEPNELNQNGQSIPKPPESAKEESKKDSDLHDEGIDIVGTGMALNNEFFEPESGSVPQEREQEAQETEPISAQAAMRLNALQEIPNVPKAPRPPQPQTETPQIPTSQKKETPAPAPEPDAEKISLNDPSIKPLRTFKSDAEEAVRYQNVSAVDIAVAEQKKRERSTPINYENEKKSSPGLFIAGAIILILVLAGGWYFWFSSSQTKESAPVSRTTVETIIPYSKGSTVTLDSGSDPLSLISAKLAVSNAGLGNVFALIPVTDSASTEQAPVLDILKETHVPDRLRRSLGQKYMLGTYTYDDNGPFLILKNTFFQNAYAGMLEWEKDLRNDLLSLIHVSHPNETAIEANTDQFEDLVVSNIDARVLKNAQGEIILAYAFADKDTIVITTNTNALKYILDRLLTVRTIQ